MTFEALTPSLILEAVSAQGFRPTGALLSLNSYENRVYEIAVEEQPPLVGKFYRPGRWPLAAIVDEHRLMRALDEAEFPLVAPLPLAKPIAQMSTLAVTDDFVYALFPRFCGRGNPDLSNDDRKWLGRMLARLHTISAHVNISHRLTLDPDTYGYDALEFILSQPFLPIDLAQHIETSLLQALVLTEAFFEEEMEIIPVHGDCHLGNILWNSDGPHLLDFDDMLIAPPVQDIWMLFYGDPEEVKRQQDAFFEGYDVFRRFDHRTLILAEPLRTLRMIHYAAWIGKRYGDPAFQSAFPYYRERRYWEEFLLSIKEQISLLQEL